ncbi:hypothetical protein AB162_076 [Candidatus Palibaumannia cicadellinicola]|uniref:Uncharacterized protein n=2 Tax=Candidatus Palibaumannia cicadellinicola TaxID=186490 RepID=A0A0K2BKH4_9GAMM|nr:hypothetical protein AB162_076 [Candidatus Baumannia cicadellinicola]
MLVDTHKQLQKNNNQQAQTEKKFTNHTITHTNNSKNKKYTKVTEKIK